MVAEQVARAGNSCDTGTDTPPTSGLSPSGVGIEAMAHPENSHTVGRVPLSATALTEGVPPTTDRW